MPTPHQMTADLANLGYQVLVVGPGEQIRTAMQQVLPHVDIAQQRMTNGTLRITTTAGGELQVNPMVGARGYSAEVLVTVGLASDQVADVLSVLNVTGRAHINL